MVIMRQCLRCLRVFSLIRIVLGSAILGSVMALFYIFYVIQNTVTVQTYIDQERTEDYVRSINHNAPDKEGHYHKELRAGQVETNPNLLGGRGSTEDKLFYKFNFEKKGFNDQKLLSKGSHDYNMAVLGEGNQVQHMNAQQLFNMVNSMKQTTPRAAWQFNHDFANEGVDIDGFRDEEIDIDKTLRDELWPIKPKPVYSLNMNPTAFVWNPVHDKNDGEIVVGDVSNKLYLDTLGNLGNQMFQYAAFYAIGKQTGKDMHLSERSVLPELFPNIQVNRGYDPQIRIYIENGPGIYTPSLIRQKKGDITICCYLQSWFYFQFHTADIKRQFRFSPSVAESAKLLLSQMLHNFAQALDQRPVIESNLLNDIPVKVLPKENYQTVSYRYTSQVNSTTYSFTVISVHVRRLGLDSHRKKQQGYGPAPLGYVRNAMEYYRKLYKNSVFLVISDDMRWCRANISQEYGDVIFVNTSAAIADLALLTLADHAVMTLGSYGWWGAWLAGGSVVYYNNWPTEGSKAAKLYNSHDYYPSWWIGMDEHG